MQAFSHAFIKILKLSIIIVGCEFRYQRRRFVPAQREPDLAYKHPHSSGHSKLQYWLGMAMAVSINITRSPCRHPADAFE